MKNLNFLYRFFYSYPSLFFCIFYLLGTSFFLYQKIIVLFFFIFVWNRKKLFIAFFIFFFAFLFSSYFFSDIKKINKPIEGISKFKINSIKEIYNFGSKYYLYNGVIKSFQNSDKNYKNIEASISSKKLHSTNYLYQINGTLIPNDNFYFYIKTKKYWEKISSNFSLTQTRYNLKKRFYKYLKKTIKDKHCADFLHTLITGENTHKFLSFSFSKIGLQHVLAISGFHFGIFTFFFTFFLRLFLPKIFVTYCLIILVTMYFLFIGPLISVQRTFLMIQMALFAQILNRKYLGLHALGISLIIILIINPINVKNIGFQLSFLSSFAILLGYPIVEELVSKIFYKRTPLEIKNLNIISKIGLHLLNFLKQGLILSVCINIFILPVVLYHFHKFALLSLLYNLFIPFLIGISLILIIIGALFYIIIPPLGLFINSITTIFTKIILKLIIYPPYPLQFYLRCKNVSFEFIVLYLIIVTFVFISLRFYLKKENIPEYCNFL